MSYERYRDFYKFYNKKDFIEFIQDFKHCFDSEEDWENFFGFSLQFDIDTGEILESLQEFVNRGGHIVEEPDSYPAIAFCVVENSRDRFGKSAIRIFDYVTDEKFKYGDSDEYEKPTESGDINIKVDNNTIYKNYLNPCDTEIPGFKEAVYSFLEKGIKNKEEYSYMYTALHKLVDYEFYMFEVEYCLDN